ncbi:L-threonylcarbamoyladenylate synthase [Aliiroseovarius subalbicans]|uniref:L-threonylcarbamoyladenylate synthase n=1 Tax=Aliiroseovarius subalbicans TaxID=2925840 RepID=UPI001F598F5E|nr:L-threonylcarbamoyladenylate synthase [Aliiroseovarius subalbicans]MCI2399568.1 threonylcarbamoyl-AMP synthase [Aliiroseovarius subalbicans]
MTAKIMQTELLQADDAGIARAATLLNAGGLVSFPTETVYGLGANARDDVAVARIYEAKGRPSFNPLIVHVPTLEAARALAVFDDQAERLAGAFWPGPLTLVLPLKEDAGLSPLVSAGLATVALRVPEHPLAQNLLTRAGVPVAAPSANPSGRISPTQADHVMAGLSGRIEAVLDGGTCGVGVESTIVGFAPHPVLLRAGGLPVEAITACLGAPLSVHAQGDGVTAPGQLASHYAPTAAMRLNADRARPGERLLGFGAVEADLNLSPSGDLVEAAANLFRHLHTLDAGGDAPIAVSPVPDHGLGRAINDRLRRAAAPRV